MKLNTIIMIVSAFVICMTTSFQPHALGEEQQDIKKELKELRQLMESMQERMTELEKRNNVLEKQASEKAQQHNDVVVEQQSKPADVVIEEESKVITVDAPEQQPQNFLTKTLQKLNPEISVIGSFAAALYSLDDPSVFAEADPENTGVNVQEIEVGFQSVVDSYFRFDSFLSFGTEGVELEEAFATTLLTLPANSQFRLGRARAKFGRINQQHRHNQNFVTLPLVAAQFLGEHLNPTSIEANFLVPVPWYMELSASGGSPDVETPTFDRDEDANNLANLLYVFHLANFFELSESLGVSLGGSYAAGTNNTGSDERSNLFGIDLFAKYRPLKNNPYQELMIQSEFMYLNAATPEEELKNWGFYADVVYRFSKRWNAGFRYGVIDTDTPVIEEFDEDLGENELDVPGELLSLTRNEDQGHREEISLGLEGRTYRISPMLTFNPSEFSRIRLQYDYLNQSFAENQHAIFLQFQYSIGAHGSHPY